MVYILFYTRNLIPSIAGLFVRELASGVYVGVCRCLFILAMWRKTQSPKKGMQRLL